MYLFHFLSLHFRLPTNHLVRQVRNLRRQYIRMGRFLHLHSLFVKILHHINPTAHTTSTTMDSMKPMVGRSHLLIMRALATAQYFARALTTIAGVV
jgi:hypothetical protein